MSTSNQNLPLRHISIRAPWHDDAWRGTVCRRPKHNGACLRLSRIAENRDDAAEEAVAGKSIKDLDADQWPCCVAERGMFMAPFEYTRTINHPYKMTSKMHAHFAPTPLRYPKYSAAAVPFRWMFRETVGEFAKEYDMDVDLGREPELGFKTSWIQEKSNQGALFDCFFGHVKPEKSLCFFYVKELPFVEAVARRILVGVGRVQHVGNAVEYEYAGEGKLHSLVWERMVQHSIRPDFKDGFLLPYHEAFKLAEDNPDFDPTELVAFAPEDRWVEFSFASELVSYDGAISALLSCDSALIKASKILPGSYQQQMRWIHDRLGELWRMRGPCPGLGAALCAFGIEYGTFVGREIESKLGQNEDPWPFVEKVFEDPSTHLSPRSAQGIGVTMRAKWKALPEGRRKLLKLISRFDLTPDQAKKVYVVEERQASGVICSDQELIANPYLIYETTRLSSDPVSLWTVDRGLFPDESVRNRHPLPEPSNLDAGTDARRVRAFTVKTLENAAANGDTLMARSDVVLKIRHLEIQPECPVDGDLMAVAESGFSGEIEKTEMADDAPAYQLSRLTKMGDVIRRVVGRRIAGKRLGVTENWKLLLDQYLDAEGDKKSTEEEKAIEAKAREEKAAALEELANSRLSVLIGPAGTGKTTLLSVLCSQPDIKAGEVLLLAPTGKARVRMEQMAGMKELNLKGLTIAQFLSRCDRYDGETGRYHLSNQKAEAQAKTVIIDEASMLTEEMLGALVDSLKGVDRLILVGDARQLPPIGAGRPLVDIVFELAPENIHSQFPRVAPGCAELTIRRRQQGKEREDLQLAEWFSGSPIEPGEDQVFDQVVESGQSEHVRFLSWDTPDKFQDLLVETLAEELALTGPDDWKGFEVSLGAMAADNICFFNRGAAASAENWQILSPVRGLTHGVSEINRLIHRRFRSRMLEYARQRYRKVPRPMGAEEIVYGDKVINIANHAHKNVYPKEGALSYIANGEMGIVIGQFKTKKMKGFPWLLKVEFASQMGFQYDFSEKYFGDEAAPILELAYALTVHKSQGSEFELVFLVLPNPCRLLSRELLYTALTRQRQRVVILHQGMRSDLKKFASDHLSVTAQRLTNLFKPPCPVEYRGRFYEDRLINLTRKGEMVRSKSEVIIADRLADHDVDYLYEQPLTIEGVTKYPDFTIEDAETGQVFYWEHCGMLHDPGYRLRWEDKKRWYKSHGIVEPEIEHKDRRGTLIVTSDNEKGGISSQEIESVIKTVILA